MKRKVYIETSVISYLTARSSSDVIEADHQQSIDCYSRSCQFANDAEFCNAANVLF